MASVSSVNISQGSSNALGAPHGANHGVREATQVDSTSSDKVALASRVSANENAVRLDKLGKERTFQKAKRAEGSDHSKENPEKEPEGEQTEAKLLQNKSRSLAVA